ncbi:MAG: YbhB/YbcL family Raf kinase inhibitor-like protein [Candidatus Andersenbacteria bacterium]|nr:YbhB/YbcL family Raf kinase inhibitor-like protein [Candidatus Andersenbacteria bacterium]
MKLTSSAWQENGIIPTKYTCDGDDVSPPLTITGVPAGAQSLAMIVDDPDAPAGDWVHWTAWNIPPSINEISEGSTPAGAVEGATDFGKPGYGGPCPPSGEHRYQFKLYALDGTLDLPASAGKAEVEQAMAGHILGQALLVGRYSR